MPISIAENRDCMDAMKEFPDQFFDLAVVDPPYGDAGGEFKRKDKSRFGGQFDRYRSHSVNVERERELNTEQPSTSLGTPGSGVIRTGGTWAAKFSKKSYRGTLRRGKNISRSCSVSHAIRLFGVAITSRCLRQDVF